MDNRRMAVSQGDTLPAAHEVPAQPASAPGGLLPIDLLTPGAGEVTAPLQRYRFPEEGLWHHHVGPPEATWKCYQPENDRSLPRTVAFAWRAPVAAPDGIRYELSLSLDPEFQGAQSLPGLSQPHVEVTNLQVGMTYYWKVSAWVGQNMVAQSPVGIFLTNVTLPRWINAPGITNVRDLGGWQVPGGKRVRQGMIYRGSELNNHCTINEAGRAVLQDELGIRTDLDLRGLGDESAAVLDLARVDYINIPLIAYDLISSPQVTARYRTIFHLLAQEARYPIYFHCWGGADRTGTVAFLLLALLGVSLEDIYTDYELTSMSIWGKRSRNSGEFPELLQTLALFDVPGSSLQAQVENYLRVIGVSPDEVMEIRRLLMD